MSWEKWVEIGREYVRRAREANAWVSILYGLAHTHLMEAESDVEAVKRVLKEAPTPEEARRKCPLPPTLFRGLPLWNAKTFADAVCDKARNYELVARALKRCQRSRLQALKLERLKSGAEELDTLGLRWKGIDMMLLDSGCEVPVIDRHLARYLARVDARVRELLGEPSSPEFERKLKLVQESPNPSLYNKIWEIAVEHARRAGLPPGVWHVAVWMREHTASRYPWLSEEKRLELAEMYVKRIFK